MLNEKEEKQVRDVIEELEPIKELKEEKMQGKIEVIKNILAENDSPFSKIELIKSHLFENCEECKRLLPRTPKENPESFIMKAVLTMAQQSSNPEIYEKFEEFYDYICDVRHLHSFKH